MMTPPPVSGEAYPTLVGAETRTNYLTLGMIVNSAYDDNLLPGGSGKTVSDFTYSMWPTIMLNRTTPRQQESLTYNAGFTFYQPTSALNGVDQDANLNIQYRVSQHTTISLRDFFLQSSNVFSQSYPFFAGGVAGSAHPAPAALIIPFAAQISDAANGAISYQFGLNGMIGAGGSFSMLDFPKPSEAPGLYNSSASGASAFYSRRLSQMQYLGVVYQYSRSLAHPLNSQSETQTNAFLPFYTLYLNRTISLSLSGGPQHYSADQSNLPASGSWSPEVTASIGWQKNHVDLAGSYSRFVSGGGGLLGAFTSNLVNASVRWRMTRTLTLESAGLYTRLTNATPLLPASTPGGRTTTGTISLQRAFGEHFSVLGGYDRLHEGYAGLTEISSAPDSDRVFVSITYQFTRPIGR